MARAAKSSRVTYYGTWTVSRALLALQRKLKNELIETANGVLLIRRGSLGIKLLGAVDYLNNYTGYRVSLCNTKTLKAMAKYNISPMVFTAEDGKYECSRGSSHGRSR